MNKMKRESGVAMVFALMAIIVIAGILTVSMGRMQLAKTGTDNTVTEMTLEEAAQGGIDMVTKKLWRDYINTSGNTTRNWASYRAYLNNTLAIPIQEDLDRDGVLDPGEDGNGNGQLDRPTTQNANGKEMLSTPYKIKNPDTAEVLATVSSVKITRFDSLQNTWMTIKARATIGDRTKTAVQVLEIGAPTRNHAQFAILANNVSCILCHADIRSLPMDLNTAAANYNTFDRIKVAALESVVMRKTEAESQVAGTLYSRGKMLQQNFAQYTASELNASTFKSYKHSSVNGKLVQSSTGALTTSNLTAATTLASGDLQQFANLYLNYPATDNAQTDGPVPNSFPAPYPDENGNRVVDDSEFQQVMNTASGRITFSSGGNNQGGAIKTGTAYGVAANGTYPFTSLPTSSNAASSTLSTQGYYNGNLVLVGTSDDPISIAGTVAINGDLVIKGPIKGEGQILVRGNTYIAGDVTYKDGSTFGKAADGKDNAFALVSGGNVMMGDYLTVRGVNHSVQDGDQYPDSAYSIDMRTSTKSVSLTLKNSSNQNVTETLKYGYNDPDSVDAGQVVSGRKGQQFSFTTAEMSLFNFLEYGKAKASSTYKPRFYGLRSSQPNNIWMFDNAKGNNQEHAVRYTYAGMYTLANYIASFNSSSNIATRATYQYMNPKNNWMSETVLRKIWWDDEQARPSSGGQVKFDGLLYSNNSIFAISRSKTRHKANTNGQMTIRGGVIAADLGIFVPEGLKFQYDPRVERFIEIRDSQVVTFVRTAFYFEEPA